jgi:hypothetical protein
MQAFFLCLPLSLRLSIYRSVSYTEVNNLQLMSLVNETVTRLKRNRVPKSFATVQNQPLYYHIICDE